MIYVANLENNNAETSMVDSTENKENTTKNNEVATEAKEKTFTQEDINKIIAKTIAKERKRAEEEKTEAEKLAKMTAEERAKAEFEREKAKFEEERQAYLREKLELQVAKELTDNNLPGEFSKYLTGKDAESSKENIKEFTELFNNALEKLVTERLKGQTPSGGKSGQTSSVSKEQFKKMSILERQKLYERDRELFEQLSK